MKAKSTVKAKKNGFTTLYVLRPTNEESVPVSYSSGGDAIGRIIMKKIDVKVFGRKVGLDATVQMSALKEGAAIQLSRECEAMVGNGLHFSQIHTIDKRPLLNVVRDLYIDAKSQHHSLALYEERNYQTIYKVQSTL
ncbi:MAG: hypothetical protein LBQ49_02795 [Rickettsiales bacterium]|jgi:hypothetical protein|nr:hypothetical protein [Rickettsiales bacterium]